MTWQTSADLDDFDRAAGPLLRANPAAHTIPLSTLDTLRRLGPHAFGPADPRFGWWVDGDATVRGAVLWTPPFPVLLTMVPAPAAAAVPGLFAEATGFNVDESVADAIRAAYRERTGVELAVSRRTRLHRLQALTPPDPGPPGAARPATADDRDLARHWYGLFHREVGHDERDVEAIVDDRIADGGLWLWEVNGIPVSARSERQRAPQSRTNGDPVSARSERQRAPQSRTNGIPVALAARTRPNAGVVRIGPVFTPVEWRQQGYAGAVTVAVTRSGLAVADEVVLFTDLANPTSNALYHRLGYRPIADRVILAAG